MSLASLSACVQIGTNDAPAIVAGRLDLRESLRAGPVNLRGDWEFYWSRLLEPGVDRAEQESPALMAVPGSWTQAGFAEGGFASYRLLVDLPADGRDEILALKFKGVYAAFRVFVNGRDLGGAGRVGATRDDMEARLIPRTLEFVPEGPQLEIVIQTSSFHFEKAGLLDPVYLGRATDIRRLERDALALDLFLIGGLTIMSLYHLALFLLRRQDPSPLYFALLCALLAFRAGLMGERFIQAHLDFRGFEPYFSLELIAYLWAVPCFLLYLRSVFAEYFWTPAVYFGLAFAALFSFLILSTPSRIYTYAVFPSQIIAILISLYCIAVGVAALSQRRSGALIYLLGFSVFFVTIVNDVSNSISEFRTGVYLAPAGLLAFVLSQAFLLSQRFARVFNETERLSLKLQGRSRELERANDRLQSLNQQLFEIQASLREENRSLQSNSDQLARKIVHLGEGRQIVYAGPAMGDVLAKIEKAARSDETVLLLGESGTGKELAASLIHQQGRRADRPFIAVNCGAFSETLLESELFGHERGAFTGASGSHRGIFEQADGGTLFLDEIGEIPLNLQVKLLRVLQEKKVRRLGGSQDLEIDVRIIAATNRNLRELAAAREFREDLFYRLNVVLVKLPSLRERGDDIVTLVHHYLKQFSEKFNRARIEISEEALQAFREYDWPGNIRELENTLLRAVVNNDSSFLQLKDFPELLKFRANAVGPAPAAGPDLTGRSLEEAEARLILDALEEFKGNKTLAAQSLGINRSTLYRKMERYGLS